jgi:hypothetical protein
MACCISPPGQRELCNVQEQKVQFWIEPRTQQSVLKQLHLLNTASDQTDKRPSRKRDLWQSPRGRQLNL